MISYLIRGVVLGTSAGASPGPLLALVISETLKHDYKAGLKVAMAPLITDAPIIVFCLVLTRQVSEHSRLFGILACCGALYLAILGIQSLCTKSFTVDVKKMKSQSLLKGMITNWLNPHPYLFWLTVGAAIMWQALAVHTVALILFFIGFYVCLVGAKVLLALVISATKTMISEKGLVCFTRVMGLILLIFAVILGYEGISWLVKP